MKNIAAYKLKSLFSFILLGILLLYGITHVNAQTTEKIPQQLIDSTVLLKMRGSNGRSNAEGSGFVIGPGIVVTNYHVISKAESGTAKLVHKKGEFDIEGYIAIDEERDLAIIKVANLAAPSLPLGNSEDVYIGDAVCTVGNPRGLEGTFSDGSISNILTEGTPRIRGKVLQFTAAISPGSSGGPVANQKGEVIGIVAETRDDGQNLNFAIPVNSLKRLIERSVPVTIKPFVPDTVSTNAERGPLSNFLSLAILFAATFCIINFLPTVKTENLLTVIGIAIGIGVIKIAFTSIITHQLLPAGMSHAVKTVLTARLPEQDLLHVLGCTDCFPRLLMALVKFPAYIIIMAFLLGIINKIVPKFELEGFFNTFFVAALIVGGEALLYWLIPWV